jgi:F420H(2)-dependent quinone reductase
MSFANRVVCRLLESPAHRLMSGSTDVIRYRGRRSGRTVTTPTQYATYGDGLVIFVGRPDSKRWWRNFRQDRDIDVLVAGDWRAMVGRAVVGSEDPETVAPLLEAYLQRFPKVARRLATTTNSSRQVQAVVVWCRPR